MSAINSWQDFLNISSPFLISQNPLAAMARAGITFGGEVGAALNKAKPKPFVTDAALAHLLGQFGTTPPPIRLHVGRQTAPVTTRFLPGGYQLTAAANLSVLDDVLAAVVPPQLSADISSHIITLADLSASCSGIPPGTTALQGIIFPTPPRATAGATASSIRFDVSVRFAVQGSTAPGLVALLHLDLPLAFVVTGEGVALSSTDQLVITLEVDPSSTIVPTSSTAQAQLTNKIQSNLRALGPFIAGMLELPFSFDNVNFHQVDAVTQKTAAGSFLIAGATFGQAAPAQVSVLSGQALPDAPATIHAAVDVSLLQLFLDQAVSSGSFASAVNKNLGASAQLEIKGASVTLDAGKVTVRVNANAVNACSFKDLSMEITITGKAAIGPGGALTLASPAIDVDVSNVDAVICTVLSAISGPVGMAIVIYVLNTLAPSNVADMQIVGALAPLLLPGTEKDFLLTFLSANTIPRTLRIEGTGTVIADQARTFVYLKVVTGLDPRFPFPVADAKVDLLELDNPAPSGDDIQFNPTPRPGFQLSYKPGNDQFLGTQTTDTNGLVQFVVIPNLDGGTLTESHNVEDPTTGKLVRKVTGIQHVFEAKPDFGVTITAKDGTTLLKRKLIELNDADRHVGSANHPLIVRVDSLVIHK